MRPTLGPETPLPAPRGTGSGPPEGAEYLRECRLAYALGVW